MGEQAANPASELWLLRGPARQLAAFVAVGFLAGAVIALLIDVGIEGNAEAGALQAWTLVSQLATCAGLFLIGRQNASASFVLLGVLIALIAVEEAFHVLNPVAERLVDAAESASEWSGVRFGVLAVGLVYGGIAVVGFSILLVAYLRGSPGERSVVRRLALLLVVAGVFAGPIGALAAQGHRPVWIYIEELGEAIIFAVVAGYVAGIALQSRLMLRGEPRPEPAR